MNATVTRPIDGARPLASAPMNRRRVAALALLTLAPLGAFQAPADRLAFRVQPGTRLLKSYKTSHELRIDDMGLIMDDLPFVSERAGGWVSSSERVEFVDEYLQTRENLPLEFRRSIRDAGASGKANVTRQNGQKIDEPSRSSSPLRQQNIHFQWIEDERDWSRSYEKVDAEEEWLAPLQGEFELLPLLPPGEVKPGDTWSVDLGRFKNVLAPGGDLQLVPSGGSLFGRLMEIGVGGDYADFYAPAGGSIQATYKGTREVALGEGDAATRLIVGVVELQLNLASSADRTALYRMAMPEEERREAARLENVTLEYTLTGTGELLWNGAGGHFHSLTIEGQEGFIASVHKTRFDGREQHKVISQSHYSGPVKIELSCVDGSSVGPETELDNPKLKGGGKRKKR